MKKDDLTVASLAMGLVLAIVFGAANAYLGLKVDMMVSASIPAAAVSMGVLRLLFRRGSILECNMSQTMQVSLMRQRRCSVHKLNHCRGAK